jgi:hypothetical protein
MFCESRLVGIITEDASLSIFIEAKECSNAEGMIK